MHTSNNITGLQGQEGTKSQKSSHSGLSKEDIHAFLSALMGNDGTQSSSGLAAKISSALNGSKTDRADLLKQLQNLPAGQNDGVLKKLAAMLQQTPDVKPALTSDLTSNMSVTLQGQQDNTGLLDKLKAQFDAISNVTPASLSDFRQQAIKLMKDMGLDDGQIGSNLVQLTMGLGSKLSDDQATLLMMPVKTDAGIAAAGADQIPAAAKQVPATTPQQLAEQQLQAAAGKDAAAAHKAPDVTNIKGDDAGKPAPAPQQQAPLPQIDTQAAAKPAPQAASNLALINSFAAGGDTESGFDGGFSGGQSFDQSGSGYTPQSLLTNVQTASSAAPGSFINYMNGTSTASGSTMQMIALQIQHNADAKIDTFRMQLHPADLGHLEIKLKFDRDGALKAHLTADKPETLNLLQKDAGQLQRVLQGAGLNIDEGSLSFNLRQQQQDNKPYNGQGASSSSDAGDDDMMSAGALQAKIAVEQMGSISQGGVNIMV